MAIEYRSEQVGNFSPELSAMGQLAIRYNLDKLSSALTYDNAKHRIPRAYADTCVSILCGNQNSQFGDNLNTYFEQEFGKTGPFVQHIEATLAEALVTRLRDSNIFFSQYLAAPTAYGLPPRHVAFLNNIELLNHRLSSELTPWYQPADKIELDQEYLKSHLDDLWQQFDLQLFTTYWNNLVSQLSEANQFTPTVMQSLNRMTEFLAEKLTFGKGHFDATSDRDFQTLYTNAKPNLAPLNEANYSFLLNQLANLKHPQLDGKNTKPALQKHHKTLSYILNAYSDQNTIGYDQDKSHTSQAHEPFAIPEKIQDIAELDSIIRTLNLTPDVNLSQNAPLINILFKRCGNDANLHARLFSLTLKLSENLRRQFHIDSQREHFQLEIACHFWMQRLLVNLCQYKFNVTDDSIKQAEAIEKLTRDILTLSQSQTSGIERIYQIMDKVVKAKLLESSANNYLLPLVKQVPGLETLEDYNSQTIINALTIFRDSVPYQYLVTQSKPAFQDTSDLTMLAKQCVTPEVVKLCKDNRLNWQRLAPSQQSKVKHALLDKFYAHTPFDFAHKQFGPQGSVPTARLWDWDRLNKWFDSCRNQQTFAKATSEDQNFLAQEHKHAQQQMARYKKAFLQNHLGAEIDKPVAATPMAATTA